MDNRNKMAANKEAILVALDQLSQTMDVMNQVINRLKRTVEQAHIGDIHPSIKNYEVARQNNLDELRKNYIRKKAAALQQKESHETDLKPIVVLH